VSPSQVAVDDLCRYVRVEAPARLSKLIRAGLLQPLPEGTSLDDKIDQVTQAAVDHFCDLTVARVSGPQALRVPHPPGGSSNSTSPELTSMSSGSSRYVSRPGVSDRLDPASDYRISASLHPGANVVRPTEETQSLLDGLPEMDNNFWDLLELEQFPKYGDSNWDCPLPEEWTSGDST
jgi:hypothetical protein